MAKQLKKLCNAMSYSFYEDEEYNVKLYKERFEGGKESPIEHGLYLVTITYKPQDRIERSCVHYVLAEDEDGAMAQVMGVILGEHEHDRWELEQSGALHGTATRLPLVIRGWGSRNF